MSERHFLLPAFSLLLREIRIFFRQRSRIVAALGTPILFWVLIGSGVGQSIQMEGMSQDLGFLQYFFPGTLLLIILFTSIFSTISIIQDRREGFLQSVLVAPVSPAGIALGKIMGGMALALVQGGLFLLAAPWLGFSVGPVGFLLAFVALGIIAFGLTGLGFFFAWRMESIQGYHGVMNLLLFPMWLLSGALFPETGSLGWIRPIIRFNPLYYGHSVLRHALHGGPVEGEPSYALSWAVILGFALIMFGAATWTARKRSPIS